MCDWRLLASRLFHSWRLVSSTPARPQPLMRSASSKHDGRSSSCGTTCDTNPMRSASPGVDVAAGEHDLGGPGVPHGSWQEEAQPELGRGQAVVDPRCPEVGLLRGDANVGRQSEAEAAADGGPIDGGDHRLVQPADGGDDVVEQLHGSQRDRRQRQAVHVGHGAGVLVIRARAKAPPRSGDDDDTHVVVVADLAQRVAEGNHHVEGHGVHALRPVERDDGDLGVRSADFGEGHARHRRVPWPVGRALGLEPARRCAPGALRSRRDPLCGRSTGGGQRGRPSRRRPPCPRCSR